MNTRSKRALLTATRLPLALLLLGACAGEGPDPTPAPAAVSGTAPDLALIPPVLTATQQLAVDLLQSTFAEADLPSGASAAAGAQNPPSERARSFRAEAKVSFDIKGPNASDKLSYTIYPTPGDAMAAFAVIGEPVAERKITRSEAVAIEGLSGPVWGENSFEEYDGQHIVRTSLATVSGSAVALSQSIVRVKDGAAAVAATAFASELLRGGVQHLERVRAGGSPPASAAPAGASGTEPSPAPSVP